MNPHRRLSILLLLTVIMCLACMTLSETDYEGAALQVVELINQGAVDTLVERTRIPFVLDSELIMLEGDAHSFWKAVTESGLTININSVTVQNSTEEEFLNLFGDTMDMMVFHKNLPQNAYIVALDTSLGRATFVLGDIRWGVPEIYCFKGFEP